MTKQTMAAVVAGISLFSASAGMAQQKPAEKPALAVSIAIPEKNDGNGLRSVDLSTADPHIHVVIRNVSDHPLGLFAEDNSWGYDNLRLELLSIDGKPFPQPLVVKRSVSVWERNPRHTVTLEPGDSVVREVHFVTDRSFVGIPYNGFPPMQAGERHTIRLRAVFETGGDGFALHFHRIGKVGGSPFRAQAGGMADSRLWKGRVVSDTSNYVFNQFSP